MKLDDATKIIGCYKALIKSGLKPELLTDPDPMQRAIAFCKDIESSKLIQSEFAAVIPDPVKFYRVEKMKFGGKRPNIDKTTVTYNSNITMTGIPTEAYDYVVNGKPALEWVMERQRVKTDKASGIVNDANRYATETVGDPAYPLMLFQRVITAIIYLTY